MSRRPQGPYPGPPPLPTTNHHRQIDYVVFTRRCGWIIGRWDLKTGAFQDIEKGLRYSMQFHPAEDLLWWMPQSGAER